MPDTTDRLHETVRSALLRAYSLGQTYWQQADSESYAANKRSEETAAKFSQLTADTLAALSAAPPTSDVEPSDTILLDFIANEYLDVSAFPMPTGAGDADVGWTLVQEHEGKKGRVEVARHYHDDLRAAIREAMQALGHTLPPAAVPPVCAQPSESFARYCELLYAVHRKFSGESRHETALRYIREAEARVSDSQVSANADRT